MAADFSMHGGSGRFTVEGELDLASTLVFQHVLATAGAEVTEIDLAAVHFVDSTGLRALLHARRRHPRLRYVNVSHRARRAAALAGLAELVLDERDTSPEPLGG